MVEDNYIEFLTEYRIIELLNIFVINEINIMGGFHDLILDILIL